MPISVNVAMNLSLNALTVLQKRYLRKDEDGQPIETPADLFRRDEINPKPKMRTSSYIKCMLIDLDNTLYPRDSGLLDVLVDRSIKYIEERINLDRDDATKLSAKYYQEYGTTLRGLIMHYSIEPEEFLTYVYGDIETRDWFKPNPGLCKALSKYGVCKYIFTNTPSEYARKIIDALGISYHFKDIIDIRAVGYISKPDTRAFQIAIDKVGNPAQNCLLIDDLLVNIREASRLGMTTILVSDTTISPDADYCIKRINELDALASEIEMCLCS